MTPEFLATYPAVTERLGRHVNRAYREQMIDREAGLLVVREVARRMGVRSSDLFSTKSATEVRVARAAAMRALQERLRWGTIAIGELFDRHHTTVLSALGQRPKRQQNRKRWPRRRSAP